MCGCMECILLYIVVSTKVNNLPLNIEFINLEDLLEEPGQLNDKRLATPTT